MFVRKSNEPWCRIEVGGGIWAISFLSVVRFELHFDDTLRNGWMNLGFCFFFLTQPFSVVMIVFLLDTSLSRGVAFSIAFAFHWLICIASSSHFIAEGNCRIQLLIRSSCFVMLFFGVAFVGGILFFCYGQSCVRVDMIVSVAKLLVIVCCCFVTMQVAREFKALLFWKRFWWKDVVGEQ